MCNRSSDILLSFKSVNDVVVFDNYFLNPETEEKNVNLKCGATKRRQPYPDTLDITLPTFMKYINISNIINESNSRKLKRLPGFIIKWIEKIIRQDEMNQILTKYSDYQGLDILTKIIEELNIKIEVDGIENLPENSRCFFLSNHPFGLIDGLVLTKIVGNKYHVLKSIGNEAFMYVPHLRPFIAAVNVFGKNPKEYITALENIYDSDVPITHFPSGEVSRLYNGKIQDCQWHKSFITKAVSYKRDIVPFYIYGRNSRFFYFISFVRRVLGCFIPNYVSKI